jgi:hypothetical protein
MISFDFKSFLDFVFVYEFFKQLQDNVNTYSAGSQWCIRLQKLLSQKIALWLIFADWHE